MERKNQFCLKCENITNIQHKTVHSMVDVKKVLDLRTTSDLKVSVHYTIRSPSGRKLLRVRLSPPSSSLSSGPVSSVDR